MQPVNRPATEKIQFGLYTAAVARPQEPVAHENQFAVGTLPKKISLREILVVCRRVAPRVLRAATILFFSDDAAEDLFGRILTAAVIDLAAEREKTPDREIPPRRTRAKSTGPRRRHRFGESTGNSRYALFTIFMYH